MATQRSTDTSGRPRLDAMLQLGVIPGDAPPGCDPEDFACGWLGGPDESCLDGLKGMQRRLERQVPHRVGHDARFAPDGRRGVRAPGSAAVSPDSMRVLATDSLGRVVEMRTSDATCVRMWKGYRHAQVAWVGPRIS